MAIIVSDNGLFPVWCQANIWIDVGLLLKLTTVKFQWNLEINKMHLSMSSTKWCPIHRASMTQNAPIYFNIDYVNSTYAQRAMCHFMTGGCHDSSLRALMIASRSLHIVILKHDLFQAHYEYAIINICIYLWNKICLNLESDGKVMTKVGCHIYLFIHGDV